MIELVLSQSKATRPSAARDAGHHRNTLRKKMKQLRIKG